MRERIGVDLGGRRRLEDGLAWAAAHDVHYVDACLEGAPNHPNAPASWTAERLAAVRATCERHGIDLGLHSASAVNVAETSPLLADAAERYLETYIDLAGRLGAGWIVVHGGYHFTSDFAARLAASVARLQRAAAHAERARVRLLLENLNREPEHAEIRYLAYDPRSAGSTSAASTRRASAGPSRSTTPTSFPRASTASSTPWTSAAAGRSAWPTVTGAGRSTSDRARAPSTSGGCSSASKAAATGATT
jgi:Xylose isomerase-like TIM barrel